jgi:hypothetical protein
MAAHHLAKGLAALGRNGDSMLVHMQPHEVAGLQAIAKLQGKSLTTNPHTGMPEAFDLGGFFTSFLPMIAGIALAPETAGASMLPALAGGAATGAGVSALKGEDPLMGGLMGGLGGWSGAGIGTSLSGFGGATAAPAAEATTAQLTPAQINALNPGAADISAGINASNPTQIFNPSTTSEFSTATEGGWFPGKDVTAQTLNGPSEIMGTSNYYGGAQSPLDNAMATQATANPNYLAQGAQRALDDPRAYIDSVGGNMAAAKMYGMPLIGAGISGLEPSDIYGDPITAPHKKIPTLNLSDANYPSLNLNTNYAAGGLAELYNNVDGNAADNTPAEGYGLGRLQAMSQGGVPTYAKGGYLDGPGDGMSDSIPATIEGKQPARLADGEFVVPADVVSHLGNGSTKAGSQRLYGMLDKVRKARTGTAKQGKQINPNKYMPA